MTVSNPLTSATVHDTSITLNLAPTTISDTDPPANAPHKPLDYLALP